MDNDPQPAESQATATESRLAAIIASAMDAIITVDAEQRITLFNAAAEKMFGIPADQAMGQSLDRFIPPRFRDAHQRHVAAFGRTNATTRRVSALGELRGLRSTGEEFPIEIAISHIDVGGQHLFTAIIRDLTERRRADEALHASEEKFRTLVNNAPDLIVTLDNDERLTSLNPAFERLTGWPVAEWLGRPFRPLLPPAESANVDYFLDRARRGEAVVPFEADLLTRSGRYRQMEFTLTAQVLGDQVIGFITIGRDVTERREQERELATVAKVGAALRPAVTRNEILKIALNEIHDLFLADEVALTLVDPASRQIVVEMTCLAGGIRVEPPGDLGQAVSRYVLSTGEPYVSDDLQADPNFAALAASRAPAAAACVPLIAHGVLNGALWLLRPSGLNPGELRALTTIADMAANAARRATLHAETERRLQRLAALRAIDRAVNASLDLKLTLSVLLEQVVQQLGVDAAAVLLARPAQHVLECTAARGFRTDQIERALVHYTSGPTGRIVLERRAIRLEALKSPESGFDRLDMAQAEGFSIYYGLPIIAKGQVRGVLEIYHRSLLSVDAEWEYFADALAGQAAIAIDSIDLFNNLERTNAKLSLAYDTTLEGWSRALDLRDHETEGHTQRVTEMTLRLAQAMQVGPQAQLHIRRGAILHDIGKMAIPDNILLKAGPLTAEEWAIMRQHPVHAYDLLMPIAYLREALEIPYCHHERWDGSGYPRGLKGTAIPLAARIFAVADVWDALRSDRPYRPGWPDDLVRDYITAEAGRQFDPEVVTVFLTFLEK